MPTREQRAESPNLDPRSPMVLDTRDLPRRPGVSRPVERTVDAPEGFEVELIGVPVGSPIELRLRMTSVSEGVLVQGTVAARVTGECGRCLADLDDRTEVPIAELFAYPGSVTEATTDADEIGHLQDDLIDLEPLVRDALVLSLPTNPLCRPDCRGLCPDCGVAYDDLPAGHSHEQLDSRWAALRALSTPSGTEEESKE